MFDRKPYLTEMLEALKEQYKVTADPTNRWLILNQINMIQRELKGL